MQLYKTLTVTQNPGFILTILANVLSSENVVAKTKWGTTPLTHNNFNQPNGERKKTKKIDQLTGR